MTSRPTAPCSPRARRLARELGLRLEGVVGSGPGGRIIERDLNVFLRAAPESRNEIVQESALSRDVASVSAAPEGAPVAMAQAIPAFALEADCEIDELDALRANLEGAAPLADWALRALTLALQGFDLAPPVLASPDVADAEALLIDAGPFGVVRLFPALVAPGSIALALGAPQTRAVARAGGIVGARLVSVTLTCDPRALAIAEAAGVLRQFRALMENPALLTL